MALNFSEETRKMHLVMCYIGVFIICIYLEPKTKLPGLSGTFLLTWASFGSAFKSLIHRIRSFAIDVSGVAALWQIKSCKNLHFEWKSRMCQAWCSTHSFFPSCCCFACSCFCYPMSEAPRSRRWLVGAVVFLVNTLVKDVQCSCTPCTSQKARSELSWDAALFKALSHRCFWLKSACNACVLNVRIMPRITQPSLVVLC